MTKTNNPQDENTTARSKSDFSIRVKGKEFFGVKSNLSLSAGMVALITLAVAKLLTLIGVM